MSWPLFFFWPLFLHGLLAKTDRLDANPTIRAFYERLRAGGKAKKLAITACMRKLLVIVNAMLAAGTSWRTAQPA